MVPDVSAVIVTWNARDHVDACLAALAGAGGEGVEVEVIVVDNDSRDGTAEHVRRDWPRVRVIETGRNGGMAAGTNTGLLAASAPAFLVLNSDVEVHAGAVGRMLETLRATPQAGVVAPMLRNADGSWQRTLRRFPTTWRYATEFWYLRRLAPRSRTFNGFYAGDLDAERPQAVDWAMGACLLVRREAVDAAGLLDESYFMYGEEVDWLRRMADAGWHVAYEPAARATHAHGASARRHWGRLYQVQLANHVRYVARHGGVGAGRRTRRVLASALATRAVLYGASSIVPVGDRVARRLRARAFADGRRTVLGVDPAAPGGSLIPAWPDVERGAAPGR